MSPITPNEEQTCPIGTFTVAGASSCQDCIAGQYSVTAGTEACDLCPLGTYVDIAGNSHNDGGAFGFACTRLWSRLCAAVLGEMLCFKAVKSE